MKIGYIIALAAAFMILLIACGSSNDTPEQDTAAPMTQNERELRTAIAEIITFIEVDDIDGLFNKYAAPEDLKRMYDNNTIDRAIRRFVMFQNEMLEALKEAQNTTPEFSEEGTKAIFDVVKAPSPLHFRKIDGRWYFAE